MKVSLNWLSDFIAIEASADELAEELTLAGLEVDGVEAAAPDFDGVVVAEILERRQHPNADRLSICRITDGSQEHDIVCGAPNAAAGIKVPFAPVGTELPGGLKIKSAKIRGEVSEGMLCSAKELGLSDDAQGLLVLDSDAAAGTDLRSHLALDDAVIDIDLTPNRGDCFSVLGVAREIAARHDKGPLDESLDCIEQQTDVSFDVELHDTAACPRFAGRVIEGLSTTARTPDWMQERLRRAGLRPIHPVVDVTNYVMLELGQPLHAYRLDKLQGAISVRLANAGESLELLDTTELELNPDTLVISDESGAIGLAGIMGGLSTAVDATTETIFLESAFFAPDAIQGRARRYGLHTDASVRFERGVDPSGQERAVERATALLLEISGGKPGPVVVAEDETQLPGRPTVRLRNARVQSLLGVDIETATASSMLGNLGMEVEQYDDGLDVTPPSYRFDIEIEEDLIEELARMIGYDRIPVTPGAAEVHLGRDPETAVPADLLADQMVARGYSEIVSYAFTEAAAQARILGSDQAVRLANPISQELGVLRGSLWPGLLKTAQLNQNHQLERLRLFELGTVFEAAGDGVAESTRLAGLITGSREPVHWENKPEAVDFFDLKRDVSALLENWRSSQRIEFRSETNPALNPARSAAICSGEKVIGWIGELHPQLQQDYDLKQTTVLFDINLSVAGQAELSSYQSFSKFPSVRRDLAVIVDDGVAVANLTELVSQELGALLKQQEIFDVYRGQGVDSGRKSIGIGLILQDTSRTLTDVETDDMIQQVVRRLEHELGATIRN